MMLNEKVAVVTGAGRGIGRSIAQGFSREGSAVVVNYLSSKSGADRLAEEIAREGGKAIAVQADVSDFNQVQDMLASTVERFGRIDILVNNAGLDPNLRRIEEIGILEMSEEIWDRVINTNLKGTFLCSQAAARQMVKQQSGGRIIIISSIHAITTVPKYGAYAASKGGLNTLTKVLALELAPYGITVNTVAPGPIEIERVKEFPGYDRDKRSRQIPVGRVGIPEDVANAVIFFTSEQAGYITGQVLYVDGGLTARLAIKAVAEK